MNLLVSLFGGGRARPSLVIPAGQPKTQPTATTMRIIRIRLEVAHLVLQGGSQTAVQPEADFSTETTPDGILITERAGSSTGGLLRICRVAIPEGATVDVQLATGALTVQDFRGTLQARVLSGGVSVKQSAGTFRVVVPGGRINFEQVRGEVDVLTSSGAVSARWVQGPLQATSGGGPMEFQDIDGSLSARTTNGRIDAKQSPRHRAPQHAHGWSPRIRRMRAVADPDA